MEIEGEIDDYADELFDEELQKMENAGVSEDELDFEEDDYGNELLGEDELE